MFFVNLNQHFCLPSQNASNVGGKKIAKILCEQVICTTHYYRNSSGFDRVARTALRLAYIRHRAQCAYANRDFFFGAYVSVVDVTDFCVAVRIVHRKCLIKIIYNGLREKQILF